MATKPETAILNDIKAALEPHALVFRANVGMARGKNGSRFNMGLPNGFPDLFGIRNADNRLFFIEVKTETGKLRPTQEEFLRKMSERGIICGVARSAEEAIAIVQEGKKYDPDH